VPNHDLLAVPAATGGNVTSGSELGAKFVVGASTITVDQLAAFLDPGAGGGTSWPSGSKIVNLWDNSAPSTPLRTVTIANADIAGNQRGQFVFKAISPVVLSAGGTYFISDSSYATDSLFRETTQAVIVTDYGGGAISWINQSGSLGHGWFGSPAGTIPTGQGGDIYASASLRYSSSIVTSFTLNPGSVSAWPLLVTVPTNSTTRISDGFQAIAVTGTGTSWSGTPFTGVNSGGANAAIVSQYVIDPMHAVLFIDEGTAAGTFAISDGGSTSNLLITAAGVTPANVICLGDSLTANFAVGPPYPHWLSSELGKGYTVSVLAVGGLNVDQFYWTSAQRADPYNANAQYSATATLNILVVLGAFNDFALATPPTPAAVYAKWKSYIAAWRSGRGGNTRVIVLTTRIAYQGSGIATNPNICQNVADFNTALINGYKTGDLGAHILIDDASDPVVDEPLEGYNATYIQSSDHTHDTQVSVRRRADRVMGAITTLMNGGGAIPGSGGGGGGGSSGRAPIFGDSLGGIV
jgi:hypothetical protein